MYGKYDVGSLRQMITFDTCFKKFQLSNIFITHLHIDHASGLAAIIADMGASESLL